MAITGAMLTREQLYSFGFPWREECFADQISPFLDVHLHTKSVLLGAEHGGGGGSLAHPWQMMWIKIPGTKGKWVQAMWVWANALF